MSTKSVRWLLAAVYLAAWSVLGFWGLPVFEHVAMTVSDGPTLPRLTVEVLRAGAAGCVALGLVGAGLVVGFGGAPGARGLRWGLIVLLFVPLIVVAAALFRSLPRP